MYGGRPHDDRHFAHRYGPEPVPKDDFLGAEPSARRSLKSGESVERERPMRLVVELDDPTTWCAVRSDPARENDHAPKFRTR